MICQVFHLKSVFPQLQESADPTVTAYLQENLAEMGRQGQRRPCLLICPGGGYAWCSQREAEPVALQFLPAGFQVFVLNYSVAPVRFPNQLREVAAALELIHRHADDWHCDPERVALMGFSAGGHLAAQYATCFHWPEVREVFPASKPVQASVLCYPVISADPAYAHKGSFENLLGHDPQSAEEIQRFSCDAQVTPHTPPAFLWHTATDASVPAANSLLYARALADNRVPFELHIYPAGGHGLSTVDAQTNDALEPAAAYAANWIAAARHWLQLVLGGENKAPESPLRSRG
ncbi:MAG: alpha/beta hydrolase [Gemmiger sp.]